MASPRFIGVRDVVDPYKGLQDSVAKAGDIYRQYNKDAQEAERLRKEEARQSERLGMERTAHQIRVDDHAEQQRIKDVTSSFDPYQTIENYGIDEKYVPRLNELDQQVWDYHNKKTFDTQEEAEQARLGVEKSLRALRGEARDRDVAKRQYVEHLRRQGVPIERAVVLAEAATSGYGSQAEIAANLQKQAEATDKFNVDAAKVGATLTAAMIRRANAGTGTGTSSASDAGSGAIKENFDAFKITPEQQEKAREQFAKVIGDGAKIWGVGWSGDARRTVNDITAAVNAINNDVLKHNEWASKTPGAEIRQLVDFDDAVGWVGSTAVAGSDVEFTDYGSVKTFLEDMASRRDTSEVANRARVAAAKKEAKEKATTTATGERLTGEDIRSVIPQRTAIPPVEQVVLNRIKSSYATMFPGAFPQTPSTPTPTTAATPRPEAPPSGGVNTRTGSETNDRGITPPAGGEPSTTSGEPNITGGTRTVVQVPEQPPQQVQQPTSRDILVPYSQPQTPIEEDINSAVTRMGEIQNSLADPSLSNRRKRELYEEAEVVRDSLRQLPDSDRVLETIRTNARQAQWESNQAQAAAQEEQKRRELTTREVQQIRERLAGIVSPTVRRINEDRLQQLLQVYPDLEVPSFENPRSGLSRYEQRKQKLYERYPELIPRN